MVNVVAVYGYRSLADLVMELGRVTVITGANGAGKSSLYRALRLLAGVTTGRIITDLAAEGGLESALWAGPEHFSGAMRRGEAPVQGAHKRTRPVSLMLAFTTDEMGYMVDVGLPSPQRGSAFNHDPVIKREMVFAGQIMRPASLLARRKASRVEFRADEWVEATTRLAERESMLAEMSDADYHPEIGALRREISGWRFYDSFRTDRDAPSRRPQVGVWTPVLADDGHDLAPAAQTVLESANGSLLAGAVERALEARLSVNSEGLFSIRLHQHGLLRPLGAHELSEGTLRFLLLATALLTPRPPSLMVLNEPEASLHPDVIPVVADLIAGAAKRSQIVVVSHSEALVRALSDGDDGAEGVVHHRLERSMSQTQIEGQGMFDRPRWDWGRR